MVNKTTRKRTSGLLVAMLLLLMACDKQGPMGPEGPAGPDGQNASAGGGSFTTYLTEPTGLRWILSDGWGGYAIAELSRQIVLPDSATTMVNSGGAILVYMKMDNVWQRLPFKDGFQADQQSYKYYVSYVYVNGSIQCWLRAKGANSDNDLLAYSVSQLKIMVAPATSVVPLKL